MNTVIYAHSQSKYTSVLAKFPIVSNFLKSLESFLTHVSERKSQLVDSMLDAVMKGKEKILVCIWKPEPSGLPGLYRHVPASLYLQVAH